jgi:hypothetical protein
MALEMPASGFNLRHAVVGNPLKYATFFHAWLPG